MTPQPRRDCFATADKSIEAQVRGSRYSLKGEAQDWMESAQSFTKGSRAAKKKERDTREDFDTHKGTHGNGKYQSIASASSGGRTGSPQRYSAAFKGVPRQKARRPKGALKEADDGRVGPGSYDVDSPILGSTRRAGSPIGSGRESPWALRRGVTQEDARFRNIKNPAPGQYDHHKRGLLDSSTVIHRREGLGTVPWTAQCVKSERSTMAPVWQVDIAANRGYGAEHRHKVDERKALDLTKGRGEPNQDVNRSYVISAGSVREAPGTVLHAMAESSSLCGLFEPGHGGLLAMHVEV